MLSERSEQTKQPKMLMTPTTTQMNPFVQMRLALYMAKNHGKGMGCRMENMQGDCRPFPAELLYDAERHKLVWGKVGRKG
jgi:hypothetical protein